MAVPDMVPAGAAGYYAVKDASWDELWMFVDNAFAEQQAVLARMKEQLKGNAEVLAAIRRQEALIARILDPIHGKLKPAMRGEMGFVLGPAAPLTLSGLAEAEGIVVPTGAVIVLSAKPDQIIEGFRDLVRGIAESLVADAGSVALRPLALLTREEDGLTVHELIIPGMRMKGFEPHLARVGNAFVLSSSFALTRQIREAAAGRAPRVTAGATHRAMAAGLDPKAWEVSFLDGDRVHALLGKIADGIFETVGRNMRGPTDRETLVQVKDFVHEALRVAHCFRGHFASLVREGEMDVQREWTHFEDVGAK
jgi:hypothetical protein